MIWLIRYVGDTKGVILSGETEQQARDTFERVVLGDARLLCSMRSLCGPDFGTITSIKPLEEAEVVA